MIERRRRRLWEDDEKRRIVAQTRVTGVSVSQVARRYDVNANLVFKWLRDPRFAPSQGDTASFFPVEVVSEQARTCDAGISAVGDASSEGRIEIEVVTGHRVSVTGAFDPDLVIRLVRGLAS